MPTIYNWRSSVTPTVYTWRPTLARTNTIAPIITGLWNDLATWSEIGKYWNDAGDWAWTVYSGRPLI